MTQILRPRFGQLCFQCCENVVPAPRIRELRARKEDLGLPFLKSDVLCLRCGFDDELRAKGIEPRPRQPR